MSHLTLNYQWNIKLKFQKSCQYSYLVTITINFHFFDDSTSSPFIHNKDNTACNTRILYVVDSSVSYHSLFNLYYQNVEHTKPVLGTHKVTPFCRGPSNTLYSL